MDKLLFSSDEVFEMFNNDDVILIDVRSPAIYDISHIPNSLNIYDFFSFLTRSTENGLGEFINHFRNILSKLPLDDKYIIFYDNDIEVFLGASSRAYWITKFIGYDKVGILNGGIWEWQRKNYPVTDKKTVIKEVRNSYNWGELNTDIFISAKDLSETLTQKNIRIIDNRDKEEWQGRVISPYGDQYIVPKGKIPGAVWIEWKEFLTSKNGISYFKQKDEILEICAQRNIFTDDEIVIYCFKGARSSNTFVALKLAGFRNVKNYFSSWYDWAQFDFTEKDLF